MISLCTVVINASNKHLSNFLENATTKLQLVDEILICNMSGNNEVFSSKTIYVNDVKVVFFDCPPEVFKTREEPKLGGLRCSLEHAIGLRQCINRAKNDYVILTDNDLFFYTAADQIYYKLSQEHDLSFVGVASVNPQVECVGYFPLVYNMLIRKKDLDGIEQTPDLLVPGEYLAPQVTGHIIDQDKYVNHLAMYDTGCFLYIWAKRNNLNWFSFLTHDMHLYLTKYWRSNKTTIKFKHNEKLLWHESGSTHSQNWKESYAEAWAEYWGATDGTDES